MGNWASLHRVEMALCSKCLCTYEEVVNVSAPKFSELTKEQRSNYVCPSCCAKNLNTTMAISYAQVHAAMLMSVKRNIRPIEAVKKVSRCRGCGNRQNQKK